MIGETIRSARLGLGLTLREAAERSRLGVSTVSAYEREARHPSLLSAVKLASVLGMPYTEIYIGRKGRGGGGEGRG